jgi:hypothetical protein
LLRFYELELQRACRDASFDRAVTATAVVFLKRFYLRQTAALLPPSELMCVAAGVVGPRHRADAAAWL